MFVQCLLCAGTAVGTLHVSTRLSPWNLVRRCYDYLDLRDANSEAQRFHSVLRVPQVGGRLEPRWCVSRAHLFTALYSLS